MDTIQTVLAQPEKLPVPWKPKKRPVRDDEATPTWYSHALAAALPPERIRVQCPRCFGHGSGAGRVLVRITNTETGEVTTPGCIACWDSYADRPCPAHICHVCDGSGFVCPQCRGDRFINGDFMPGHPQFGQALKCHVCTEGNGVNEDLEKRAITTYLAKHPAPQW